MNTILEISDLYFSYEDDNKILDGINFKLYKGDILCVKGKNGAGKTTLLKVLTTILNANKYKAKYLEKEMPLKEIKNHMIYVPSSPYLYESLTGWQNIELIRNLWKRDKKKFYEKINNYALEYEMNNYLGDFVENYSLGMKYKVFFVAALALDCSIVLMDEPLNAMDDESQKKAIHSLKEIVQEGDKAIIFSSHISGLISDLATKECIIRNGKIELLAEERNL